MNDGVKGEVAVLGVGVPCVVVGGVAATGPLMVPAPPGTVSEALTLTILPLLVRIVW